MSAVLAAVVGLSTLTLALAAPAEAAAPVSSVVINEVKSNPNPDFVELLNTGATAVDITGWKAVDNDPAHTPITITTATTVLQPGGYFAFNPDDAALTGHFGLGSGDSITIYDASGTLVDTFDYAFTGGHATPSYGRCPNGTGSLVANTVATPGAANTCPAPTVVINEVRSNPNPDIVELLNTGAAAVDITGWKAVDNDPAHTPITITTATTVLLPGGYFTFNPDDAAYTGHFGLGSGDSITIFDAAGTQVATYDWAALAGHATPSYGRCPNGTGAIVQNTAATPGATNACPDAGPGPTGPPSDVKLNEVSSNPTDFFELINTGTNPVDLNGWTYVDDDPTHTPVAIASTSSLIQPGALRSVSSTLGLGQGDTITVRDSTGTAVVTFTWPANTHAAPSYARCPDGTGSFQLVLSSVATAGTANTSGCPAPATVKAFETASVFINEVSMNSAGGHGDFVEVKNIGATAVDVSGWGVRDDKPATTDWQPFPSGTLVPAGGRVATETSFGLGGDQGDEAHLLLSDKSTELDAVAWVANGTGDGTVDHRLPYPPGSGALGRCLDDGAKGTWQRTNTATFGATNDCTLYTGANPVYNPDDGAQPWPGSATVTTSDRADMFALPADGSLEATLGDASGAVFDPADPRVLWVAKNKHGTLWKLEKQSDGSWAPATGWEHGKDPHFVGGSGHPDTEGLTVGPDGHVYMTSERNNDSSTINQNVVLKLDQDAADLTATQQWDLTAKLPNVTANLGLEGITWVPDSYLIGGGLQDQGTHAAYDPATYPTHGTGLYVVAFEGDGNLYAFALGSNGSADKVATIASGFPSVMDVQFDPERKSLWASCDDTCQGRHTELVPAAGSFAVEHLYARPAGMPNLNNEGLAIAPQSACVDGSKEVVWTDDGNTGGHSLRSGTIPCAGLAQTVTFTSAPNPVVGSTYAPTATGGASGKPVTFTAQGSACSASAGMVTFSHAGSCTVLAHQDGGPGYEPGSASQPIVVGKAATALRAAVGEDGAVTATVSVLAPGTGSPSGVVTFTSGGSTLGTAPLVGGVATLSAPLPDDATSVTAAYTGDADFGSSQDSAGRRLPTITASVGPDANDAGWHRTPVTVTFTCTSAVDCPAPVTLSVDGVDLSVTRSVHGTDGGTATATVGGIKIDLTDPVITIAGVRAGGAYLGTEPDARCRADDELSGVASCRLVTTRSGERVTVTATATDVAGNVTKTSVSYTSPLVVLEGAEQRGNVWVVDSGRRYTLVVLSESRTAPRVLGPTRGKLEGRGRQLEADGTVDELNRYSVTLRLTLPKAGAYKLGIKSGGTVQVVKIRR